MDDYYLFYDGPVDNQIWALQASVKESSVLRWALRPVGIFFLRVAVRVLDNFEFILYIRKRVDFELKIMLLTFISWIEDVYC